MKTIRINFARQPQIDRPRLFIGGGVLLLLAVLCFWLGIGRLGKTDSAQVEKQQEIERLKQKIAVMTSQSKNNQALIRRQQAKWQRPVNLANALIQKKLFSVVALLNFLEDTLPDGVQVSSLSVSSTQKTKIRMAIKTPSFPQLIALYKRLAPYRLDISREGENDGFYQASVEITVPNAAN